ncbi:MAG: ABC transporter ATP-binding protein/permease [Opitutales bacterium]|nr:ABC transporter ATP-binding protein/permease [Opitutales bacterium]
MRTLAQVNDLLQRALAASSRIYALLDTPIQLPDTPEATPVKNARQTISLKNLSFAYHPQQPVLDKINLTIRPGEIIGLAGASGAGKTTLLSLLARFLAPTDGELYLGDQPFHELQQKAWRSHLAMVFQETFLFHTSLRENILYGRPDATMEEVRAAAKLANAQDFIEALPQGYETITGERGIKLSGGQRQRIGVARAFLANPEILLLDEPTSAVEPESERVIQESLYALMKNRTVLLSSHRPSLLQKADRIIYLEKGQIREQGTHFDLLQSDGSYARMMLQWEVS